MFGRIQTKKGTDRKTQTIKILLDSGGSSTIVKSDIVKDLRINNDTKTKWTINSREKVELLSMLYVDLGQN